MATMNSGQQNAFAETIDFMNDQNRKYHILQGGAGTGKSFFISQVVGGLLAHAKQGSGIHEIGITATTNKATAVLADSIPHKAHDIKTVYSFMNLRMSENFSTGEVRVVPNRNFQVQSGVFLIVDECSMINKQLWEYISTGLDRFCKVLFVGDKYQLNPVKEEISPIYREGFTQSTLTEPVRNSGQPALMDLCNQAVETVKTGKFFRIKPVPGVIIPVDGNQTAGILEREYTQETPKKRVLAYTNNRVVDYNSYIRELRGYGETPSEGEILSNNSMAELTDKKRLYTDQSVIVKKASPVYPRNDVVKGERLPFLDLAIEDIMTGEGFEVPIFANPKDREEALRVLAARRDWPNYFRIKNKFPDLRSIAASTCHKAQGSTFQEVIIDLNDIGKCTQKMQTARLFYVAVSRPKARLYYRGQLQDRYFEDD